MKLDLEVEEINQILGLLGQAPYGQVFKLIVKIQSQAQNQEPEEELEKDDG